MTQFPYAAAAASLRSQRGRDHYAYLAFRNDGTRAEDVIGSAARRGRKGDRKAS